MIHSKVVEDGLWVGKGVLMGTGRRRGAGLEWERVTGPLPSLDCLISPHEPLLKEGEGDEVCSSVGCARRGGGGEGRLGRKR
jgi:hypothetical protein